eukprot:6593709-Pyramimonas_sp.AAC.1
MSQTFALDKKKAIPGPPGLRLPHCFCPWRRGFNRRTRTMRDGSTRHLNGRMGALASADGKE